MVFQAGLTAGRFASPSIEQRMQAVATKIVEPAMPRNSWLRTAALPLRRVVSREAGVLLTGSCCAQLAAVLALPVLTRLCDRESFGLFATFASLCGVLAPLVALRYEVGMLLPKSHRLAGDLFAACMGIVTVVGGSLGMIAIVVRRPLAAALNAPGLEELVLWLSAALILTGLLSVWSQWTLRKRAFGLLRRSKIGQGVGQALAQIVLCVWQPTAFGLWLGQAAGQVLALVPLRCCARELKRRLQTTSWTRMRNALVRYRNFPLYSSGSVILNVASLHAPVLLLSAFYGGEVVGGLALANVALLAPWALLGTAFSQVYLAEASEQLRAARPALTKHFIATFKRLLVLGSVPLVAFVALGPWIIPLVFGRQWESAGWYVAILGPMYFAQFVMSPVSQTLNVLERQGCQLGWDAARLVLVIAALVAPSLAGYRPVVTLALYSAAMTMAYGALLFLCVAAIKDEEFRRSDCNVPGMD